MRTNTTCLILLTFIVVSCGRAGDSASNPPAPPSTSSQAAPPPAPAASVPDRSTTVEHSTSDGDEAVDVIRRYYKAIASRDFKTAFALWGESGPPGQSFDQFVRGFADTSSVEVEPGTASPVGAAAGSRYIDVPVVVISTTKAGAKQRFEGVYTLRRSVVDGASAAQRAWHIDKGALHATVTFVDRVWRVTKSASVARGTLYEFRSDGTLIVTSPGSTPLTGSWKRSGSGLVMVEESIAYPTDILRLTDTSFVIRSHNPGTPVDIEMEPAPR